LKIFSKEKTIENSKSKLKIGMSIKKLQQKRKNCKSNLKNINIDDISKLKDQKGNKSWKVTFKLPELFKV